MMWLSSYFSKERLKIRYQNGSKRIVYVCILIFFEFYLWRKDNAFRKMCKMRQN